MLSSANACCTPFLTVLCLSTQSTSLVKVHWGSWHAHCKVTDCYLACEINYHYNFKVFKGKCTYYGGIPDIIQISKHWFVEQLVIEMWLVLMDQWYICLYQMAGATCALTFCLCIHLQHFHVPIQWAPIGLALWFQSHIGPCLVKILALLPTWAWRILNC